MDKSMHYATNKTLILQICSPSSSCYTELTTVPVSVDGLLLVCVPSGGFFSDVSEHHTVLLFRATVSGSGGSRGSWEERSLSVIWPIWRKYDRSELWEGKKTTALCQVPENCSLLCTTVIVDPQFKTNTPLV